MEKIEEAIKKWNNKGLEMELIGKVMNEDDDIYYVYVGAIDEYVMIKKEGQLQ